MVKAFCDGIVIIGVTIGENIKSYIVIYTIANP